MTDPWIHLLLFLACTLPIVALGAFYAEAQDGRAFQSLPRRFAAFVIGCSVLAGILLALEHTLARV